jgi:hypothetical protein
MQRHSITVSNRIFFLPLALRRDQPGKQLQQRQ